MGQAFHGNATTTAAVRQAIRHSQASLRAPARRYGINQNTVAKWKRGSSLASAGSGSRSGTADELGNPARLAMPDECLARNPAEWDVFR